MQWREADAAVVSTSPALGVAAAFITLLAPYGYSEAIAVCLETAVVNGPHHACDCSGVVMRRDPGECEAWLTCCTYMATFDSTMHDSVRSDGAWDVWALEWVMYVE